MVCGLQELIKERSFERVEKQVLMFENWSTGFEGRLTAFSKDNRECYLASRSAPSQVLVFEFNETTGKISEKARAQTSYGCNLRYLIYSN